MTSEVVQVAGLTKIHRGGVVAVNGIEFAVMTWECFGFLHPNVAGKTTTIMILATLLKKTSGHAVVAGYDVDSSPDEVRVAIGFATQEVGLDDLSKGKDFLELQGILYGLHRKVARDRARELLELVGLSSVAGRLTGTYSGGM